MQRPDVTTLELPQIEFTSLPDLASLSTHGQPIGLHGAPARGQSLDDNHALLLPCLYELHPGI